MKAMILAAGFGTRLRPVTHTLPKPMVPLLNRPLIAWAVESFLDAGVHELVVNLHHLPEPLERYLSDEYRGRASFFFSREEEILGTGGGIRRVRPQLETEEEFFLVNGDTIQFPRWDKLRDARRDIDAVAALTLRHAPAGDKFTPVYFDKPRVTGFGKGTGDALMFAGSHVISRRIFDYLPAQEFSGIVEHAYQPLLDSGRESLAGVVDDGLWFDIGTPQRYMTASRALLEQTVARKLATVPGSTLQDDSVVHETARGIVSSSVVGARSVVEGTVRDSVIWDDCHVGQGTIVEGCILAHGVNLQPGEYRNQLIVASGESVAI